MKYIAAIALLLPLAGCPSLGGPPDWPAIELELTLTAADLTDLAAVAASLDKPGTAQALQDAAGAIQKAAEALSAGAGTGDAWGALEFALDQLEAIAAANEDADLLIGVVAAKIIVRRVKGYLPPPPST